MSVPFGTNSVNIRDVWSHNLEEEMEMISGIVDEFPYVGMDTEYPGIVLKAVGQLSRNDYHYENLKSNVNLLKLIQLGLAFSDENGNLPTCGTDKGCVWQFNFREFDPSVEPHAESSIQLLVQSGIDFGRNVSMGVDAVKFAELLMPSGVVLNGDVQWITFHGGYDFGYLVKLLSGKNLPDTRDEFFKSIKTFCPVFYDVKHLITFCGGLRGGLSLVARALQVPRAGTSHQAGSDSLLTCWTFMKLKERCFNGLPMEHAGILKGIEMNMDLLCR